MSHSVSESKPKMEPTVVDFPKNAEEVRAWQEYGKAEYMRHMRELCEGLKPTYEQKTVQPNPEFEKTGIPLPEFLEKRLQQIEESMNKKIDSVKADDMKRNIALAMGGLIAFVTAGYNGSSFAWETNLSALARSFYKNEELLYALLTLNGGDLEPLRDYVSFYSAIKLHFHILRWAAKDPDNRSEVFVQSWDALSFRGTDDHFDVRQLQFFETENGQPLWLAYPRYDSWQDDNATVYFYYGNQAANQSANLQVEDSMTAPEDSGFVAEDELAAFEGENSGAMVDVLVEILS